MVVVALLGLPAGLSSTVGGDAGTGLDAGDTRGQALGISYGSYTGELGSGDKDWYRVEESSTNARCVSAVVGSDAAADITLRVNTGDQTRTVSAHVPADGARRVAMAVPALQRSHLGLLQGSVTGYDFTLSSIGAGSSSLSGELLSDEDAGPTTATAMPAQPGCLGGELGTVLNVIDDVDVYAVQAKTGDVIYYSLVAADHVSMTVLDPSGAVAGLTVLTGQMAGVAVDTDGTYYLQASSSSSSSVSDYLAALMVGPDPGNGCRPHCFLTS